jgi:WD40 repeat protein
VPGFPDTRLSLIARLKDSSDQEAWSQFVEIYQPLIHQLALRKGLQDADAEDLTQQVFSAVAVALSPDGKLLATGGEDGMIRIWDTETGERKHLLNPVLKGKGMGRWLFSLAVSADGKLLASGNGRGITLWDMAKGNPCGTFGAHDEAPDFRSQMELMAKCIAFAPDSQMLASAHLDGTIRFWPIKSTGGSARK